MGVAVTVLYDNRPHDSRLETGWGFSCLIEGLERTVLFDTGGDGRVLLSNMKMLGKRAEQVDVVFLSHIHDDHSGGLRGFLHEHNDVGLYVPEPCPDEFRERAGKAGAEVISVGRSIEIANGIHSTGAMGDRAREQALILQMPRGLAVLTGCAHPGVAEMARKAKEACGDEIYLLLGGFHLGACSEEEVEKVIGELRGLGVRRLGASHCTGKRPTEMFHEAWGGDSVRLGCGAVFSIEEEGE